MAFKGRLREDIYLIGPDSDKIVGSKLPSNRQVLNVLFHYLCNVKINLHNSASLVIKEIELFWGRARIPTRDQKHSIKKLEDLHRDGEICKVQKGVHSHNNRNKSLLAN